MEILDTTPDNGATGIALQTGITIVFDEEVDFDSVISGNLVVTTSASKISFQGPGLESFNPQENLLSSEIFTGQVKGTFTTDDNITFLFTPESPLEPDKLYKVVVGTKVVTRTISDIVGAGGNTSTGSFEAKGPFTGVANDTFTIEIASTGTLDTATFTYTRTSTGMTSEAIPLDRLVDLEAGVRLAFTSGNYVEGDTWTFDVIPGEALDDIHEFSFTTGSATHIQVIEETPSLRIKAKELQGIKRVDNVPSVNSGTLAVVSITPYEFQSNVPTSVGKIVIEFNKNIDADSITNATIEVIMENLPLDERRQFSHKLRVTPTVSGKLLTLTFTG